MRILSSVVSNGFRQVVPASRPGCLAKRTAGNSEPRSCYFGARWRRNRGYPPTTRAHSLL